MKNKKVIIGIVVAAVLVIAGFVWWRNRQKNKDAAGTQSKPSGARKMSARETDDEEPYDAPMQMRMQQQAPTMNSGSGVPPMVQAPVISSSAGTGTPPQTVNTTQQRREQRRSASALKKQQRDAEKAQRSLLKHQQRMFKMTARPARGRRLPILKAPMVSPTPTVVAPPTPIVVQFPGTQSK